MAGPGGWAGLRRGRRRGSAARPERRARLAARLPRSSAARRSLISIRSVSKLAEEYGAAHGTIVRILRILEHDGLVRVVAGWGTFVVERSPRGRECEGIKRGVDVIPYSMVGRATWSR